MTNLQESVEQAQVTKEIDYEVFINKYKKLSFMCIIIYSIVFWRIEKIFFIGPFY